MRYFSSPKKDDKKDQVDESKDTPKAEKPKEEGNAQPPFEKPKMPNMAAQVVIGLGIFTAALSGVFS